MRNLLLLGLAACGGASGALHQGTLVGQCAAGDEACARRHPMAPIAIGARFHPEVTAEIAGNTVPSLQLESAVPDVIAVVDGALVARQPGTSAVLMTTDDGAVVDFVHVWAAPVTRLTLAKRDGDRIGGAIGLAVGEDVTLQPALWNGVQKLGGEADLSWKVSNESTVSVLHDGSSDRRRLRARAPGKATVTVAFGDQSATVEIEVVP